MQVIVLDFHAETTSEKIAMGRMLDGKVSLRRRNSHPRPDRRRDHFPKRNRISHRRRHVWPEESVLGRCVESVVWRFRSGMPTRFPVAKGAVKLCGVIVDVDTSTGQCREIERFAETFAEITP